MARRVVEYHPEALAEAQSAVAWYASRDSDIAGEFAAEIKRAIQCIQERPNAWPAAVADTRKFLLNRLPFLVV